MATTYDVELRVELIPKEVTTLGDGSDTITTIDSNIDKTMSGALSHSNIGDYEDVTAGADWHIYSTYALTSTSWISILDTLYPSTPPTNPQKILLIITAQNGATGTTIDFRTVDYAGTNTVEIGTISGVGDFICMPVPTNQSGQSDGLQLKTYTDYECTIEVFMWGQNPQ